MKTTDFIKLSLDSGKDWVNSLLQNLQGSDLTFPTPRGGNHPLWVAGHLAYAEGSLIGKFVLGEDNPLARWEPLFGAGTQAAADASRYPPLSEILSEWDRLRADARAARELHRRRSGQAEQGGPREQAAMFGTIGQCYALLANHQMFHAGQIADSRRAAGLQPVFG